MRTFYDEMKTIFAPRSVAVVGASDDITKVNGKCIHFLKKHGYQGQIYPVNPRRSTIQGYPCYPDLGSIPGEVDHVMYVIPAGQIETIFEPCKQKGVRSITVISSGFAESGDEEGKKLQEKLVRFAKETGIRIIGPNCFGFINLVDRVAASPAAALDWTEIPAGRVGLVSQSGGLGLASVFYGAMEESIHFSYLVSSGNEADLNICDYLEFLIDDPHTDVIALTVEGIKDGKRFMELADRAVKARKPILMLKIGRSELGAKMASSHTGALSGSDKVYDALFRQKGIIRVEDYDELIRLAGMFAKLIAQGKMPKDCRVAGLSVSGGHVGLFGDLGDCYGLSFPEFDESTKAKLQGILEFGKCKNPLDLSGQVIKDPKAYKKSLEALVEDPNLDVLVPIITVAKSYDEVIRDFLEVAQATSKPIMVMWPGGSFEGNGRELLRQSQIPLFKTPLQLIKALVALRQYVTFVGSRGETGAAAADETSGIDREIAEKLEQAVKQGRRALTERESKELLKRFGFPVTPEELAETKEQAIRAAERLGYPVALKGESPKLLHKSDFGIIRLNLKNEREVAEAFDEIMASMKKHSDKINGVLVQKMVDPGTEVILGVSRDETFGPTLLFGLGGIFVEILKDVSLRVLPIHERDAEEMMEDLKGKALLRGARGREPADTDEIKRLLMRLSDFAFRYQAWIREIDINPLIVHKNGAWVVDALIVLNERP